MTTTLPHTAAAPAIGAIVLEVPDPGAAQAFYAEAFGLGDRLAVRAAGAEPTDGFRAFTLSLVVARPSTVDALVGAAVDAGATVLKDVRKSFWGYGGVVRAPDGTIWKVATSAKKDQGPATREIDEVVLLLGVADVKASRRFYVERGLVVNKGFGSKYVEFKAPAGGVKLALYGRRALAKDAGVAPEGSGAHRLAIAMDDDRAVPFTDPDGFTWEAPRPAAP
jgi:predicted lactoylglutathione lyase